MVCAETASRAGESGVSPFRRIRSCRRGADRVYHTYCVIFRKTLKQFEGNMISSLSWFRKGGTRPAGPFHVAAFFLFAATMMFFPPPASADEVMSVTRDQIGIGTEKPSGGGDIFYTTPPKNTNSTSGQSWGDPNYPMYPPDVQVYVPWYGPNRPPHPGPPPGPRPPHPGPRPHPDGRPFAPGQQPPYNQWGRQPHSGQRPPQQWGQPPNSGQRRPSQWDRQQGPGQRPSYDRGQRPNSGQRPQGQQDWQPGSPQGQSPGRDQVGPGVFPGQSGPSGRGPGAPTPGLPHGGGGGRSTQP